METRTIPEPCFSCDGSGRVVELRSDMDLLPPYARLQEGIGFHHVRCRACRGHGEAHEPELPASIPVLDGDWEEPPDAGEIVGELVRGAGQSAAAAAWRDRYL